MVIMVRKSPVRHSRRAHTRNGNSVKSHSVGNGSAVNPTFVYPKTKEETEEYFLGRDPRKYYKKEYEEAKGRDRQLLQKNNPMGVWNDKTGWKVKRKKLPFNAGKIVKELESGKTEKQILNKYDVSKKELKVRITGV